MSISPMNLNVASDAYGVKEAKKKPSSAELASVQPREDAPTTLTASTPDTVDISAKKDDTSATTPATDGATPPAKAPFPVLPVAGGTLVGAAVGGGATYAFGGEDEAKGSKAILDGDKKFKLVKSDDYELDGDTVKEKAGNKLSYAINKDGDNHKLGKITGEVAVDGINYAYEKEGSNAKFTTAVDKAHQLVTDIVAKMPPAAPNAQPPVAAPTEVDYHVVITDAKHILEPVDKAHHGSHPSYEFKVDNKVLSFAGTIDNNNQLMNTTFVDSIKAHLESLKLGQASAKFKEIKPETSLGKLIELEGGGRNWLLIGGVAAGVGALGAAAGWFFGKKKPEATPDAPPVG